MTCDSSLGQSVALLRFPLEHFPDARVLQSHSKKEDRSHCLYRVTQFAKKKKIALVSVLDRSFSGSDLRFKAILLLDRLEHVDSLVISDVD